MDDFSHELYERFFNPVMPRSLHDKLYAEAWAEGHSYGYNEVQYHYENLYPLVEYAFKAGNGDITE